MKPDEIEHFRLLAMSGQQGKKSDAIRVLCDEIERLQKRSAKRNGFIAPAADEINAYAREISVLTLADCEDFLDHYTSNGWKVGRVAMTDWRAALRKWKRSRQQKNGSAGDGADPNGWPDFLSTSPATYRGDYKHAPEYLRIDFARWKKSEKRAT
jgi:hypothetical protein